MPSSLEGCTSWGGSRLLHGNARCAISMPSEHGLAISLDRPGLPAIASSLSDSDFWLIDVDTPVFFLWRSTAGALGRDQLRRHNFDSGPLLSRMRLDMIRVHLA